jgi:hypothetical protein
MHAEEAAAAELAAAELAEDDTDMASVGEPSPLPVAAAELAAAQPRLMSKVVVPIPGVYDPRQATCLFLPRGTVLGTHSRDALLMLMPYRLLLNCRRPYPH